MRAEGKPLDFGLVVYACAYVTVSTEDFPVTLPHTPLIVRHGHLTHRPLPRGHLSAGKKTFWASRDGRGGTRRGSTQQNGQKGQRDRGGGERGEVCCGGVIGTREAYRGLCLGVG